MKFDISKWEMGLLFLAAVIFQFAAVNVNPLLGQIYLGFVILSAVFIILDRNRTIHLKKGNSSFLGPTFKAVVAYGVLVIGGTYIIAPGVNKISQLLGATTPVLANVPWINNIIFGGAVPYAETTFFFAAAFDFLATQFNINIKKENLTKFGLWSLIIGISLAFMLFHLTAKGVSDYATLAIVFFMAVISLVLVTIDESYESALYFHIIANVSALVFA